MEPLKQGSRGVRGVKEEWGGVIWHPTWNTYQDNGCSPTIVSGGAVMQLAGARGRGG